MFLYLRWRLAQLLMGSHVEVPRPAGVVEKPASTPEIPDKDPGDRTYTSGNSTKWESGSFCQACLSTTDHGERMTDICLSCGHHGSMTSRRAYRKIFNEGRWKYQISYRATKNVVIELRDGEMILFPRSKK